MMYCLQSELLSLCGPQCLDCTRSRLNKSHSRRGAYAALVRHQVSHDDSARSLVTRMRPDDLGPAPAAAPAATPAAALGRPAVWPQPRFAVAGAAGAVLLPSLEDGSHEAGRSRDAPTCRPKPWRMLSTSYTATHAPPWGQVSPALRRAARGQRACGAWGRQRRRTCRCRGRLAGPSSCSVPSREEDGPPATWRPPGGARDRMA